MNGWFVNILPPSTFPSLPCSHAPSLSRSIPPPLISTLRSFPRAVHASFGPFLARSLHQPSPLTLPLLPCPSLPACLLPCNSIYTVCVYSVGELHWVLCREGPARRLYAARRGTETVEWSAISRWLDVTLATHPHDESVFDE